MITDPSHPSGSALRERMIEDMKAARAGPSCELPQLGRFALGYRQTR
jgi:hypothetical protein